MSAADPIENLHAKLRSALLLLLLLLSRRKRGKPALPANTGVDTAESERPPKGPTPQKRYALRGLDSGCACAGRTPAGGEMPADNGAVHGGGQMVPREGSRPRRPAGGCARGMLACEIHGGRRTRQEGNTR